MTSEALERLRQLMRDAGSALVTFSGGVDSALVLAVAHEQLGARALGLTADSPTFPPEERALAEPNKSVFTTWRGRYGPPCFQATRAKTKRGSVKT